MHHRGKLLTTDQFSMPFAVRWQQQQGEQASDQPDCLTAGQRQLKA